MCLESYSWYIFSGIWEAKWQLYGGEDQYEGAEAERSVEHSKEVLEWTWIVAASVHIQVWQVHPVQAGSRAGATWDAGDDRVLPGGLEVQMWQQAVHAMKIYE